MAKPRPLLPPRPVVAGGRYRTLDAIRGVAALAVAAYHFGQSAGQHGAGGAQYVVGGYLAVDLFFMLSGFVIALNYHDRITGGQGAKRQGAKRLGVAGFFRVRLLRLYPTYLVGVTIGIARQIGGALLHMPHSLGAGQQIVAALCALAMLPNLPLGDAPEALFPLNGPSWSLFLEFAVNMLFAAVLVRLRSRSLLALSALSMAWLAPQIMAPDYFNLGWAWNSLGAGVARTLFAFPLGVVAWRHMPLGARRVSWRALAVVAVAVALMVLRVPAGLRPMFEIATVAIAFPLLVVLGLRCELPAPAVPLFAFLGDISYALYAIHWPFVAVFALAAGRLGLHGVAATSLFLAGTITIASIVAYGVDPFLRGALRRRFGAKALQPV